MRAQCLAMTLIIVESKPVEKDLLTMVLTLCLDTVHHKCYTARKGEGTMPTKNPRVNIVVEPPLYSAMQDLATTEGVSMSTVARELIREAIDLREDVALAALADTRIKTLDRKKALTHKDVWE